MCHVLVEIVMPHLGLVKICRLSFQLGLTYAADIHSGASVQLWCFVKHFWHVPLAIGLILQLLCSPIGNQNFRKKTKQNITTEQTPHSVYICVRVEESLLASKLIKVLRKYCLASLVAHALVVVDGSDGDHGDAESDVQRASYSLAAPSVQNGATV